MDSSDEKSCEGVTHVCDPNVKFGCKDSGKKNYWRQLGIRQREHGETIMSRAAAREIVLYCEGWGGDIEAEGYTKKHVHDAWGRYGVARSCAKSPGNQHPTRVELQHLLQIPAFFESASCRFLPV